LDCGEKTKRGEEPRFQGGAIEARKKTNDVVTSRIVANLNSSRSGGRMA